METTTAEATPSVAVTEDRSPIELPRSGTSDYAEWRVGGKLRRAKRS